MLWWRNRMPTLLCCFLAVLFAAGLAAQIPVIVDTDAGTDDLMAIAFLLSRKDVKIEAITVVEGLAHVEAGAANVLRLLELAGATGVPVYQGSPDPLERTAPFPAEWRRTSDTLPGVKLPDMRRKPELQPAADFLIGRFTRQPPVRVLALGPLTNLGAALRKPASALEEIVIMGGAVRVPGNLGDGGFFKTNNTAAEWNIFHDPLAAGIVFRSGVKVRMIPLDATNKAPIDMAFLRGVSGIRTPMARLVTQILETERPLIERKMFFAWDPLAAVALVEPRVVKTRLLAIEVRDQGRTQEVRDRAANAEVALSANAVAFRKAFLGALSGGAAGAVPTR
jgi:inosine-uridine nucleoside N-ribohydrolase